MIRILFLLSIMAFLYGCNTDKVWLSDTSCFVKKESMIDTWIHTQYQGQIETTLPLKLIEENIQEYDYSALVYIDKFKVSNLDFESGEKLITYHAHVIETFKGDSLKEIEFSKFIDIDEKICIYNTISGREMFISLEKHGDKFYGPDVGCVSRMSRETKEAMER